MNELKNGNIRAVTYVYAMVEDFSIQLVSYQVHRVHYSDSKLILINSGYSFPGMFEEEQEPESLSNESFIYYVYRCAKSNYTYIEFLSGDYSQRYFVIMLPMNIFYDFLRSFVEKFELKGYFRKGFTLSLDSVCVD